MSLLIQTLVRAVKAIREKRESAAAVDLGVSDPNVAAGGIKPAGTPVAQNPTSVTLGLPGLGDNLQNDLAAQMAERRKRNLAQAAPGNAAMYAGGTLTGASATLFGQTR